MKTKIALPLLFASLLVLTGCPKKDKDKPIDPKGILELSNIGMVLDVNESKTVTVLIDGEPQKASDFEWSIPKTDIVEVKNGTIKGLKAGKQVVTVTNKDKTKTATCIVRVREPLDASKLWDESQSDKRTGTVTLDFYNFNDFHGATAQSDDGKEPGINALSSFLKSKKSLNPEGFVLTNSGDMWQGSADSNITRGRLVTDWLNLLDCKAMTTGNHEFDWTIDVINNNQGLMNFDLVACNIIDTSTNQTVDWVRPYTGFTVNGVNVGVVGAIGEGITSSILATNVKGLKFDDPNPHINKWAKHLKDNGADVVMVLMHDEVGHLNSTGAQNIDLLFGGHSHQKEKLSISGVPCIQGYKNGQAVGHIQMSYNFSTNNSYCERYEYISTEYLTSEDAETKALYNNYLENEINAIKSEVCSNYTGGIEYGDIPNIANRYAYKYFNDTYAKEHPIELTFTWTNQARAEIPAGHPITYGDIYKALPFDNCLCLMKMTGSQLKTLLKSSNNYGYFYSPKLGTVSSSRLVESITSSTNTYYFLAIDYIVESERYDIPEEQFDYRFREDEALPRNVFKKYVCDYPFNVD